MPSVPLSLCRSWRRFRIFWSNARNYSGGHLRVSRLRNRHKRINWLAAREGYRLHMMRSGARNLVRKIRSACHGRSHGKLMKDSRSPELNQDSTRVRLIYGQFMSGRWKVNSFIYKPCLVGVLECSFSFSINNCDSISTTLNPFNTFSLTTQCPSLSKLFFWLLLYASGIDFFLYSDHLSDLLYSSMSVAHKECPCFTATSYVSNEDCPAFTKACVIPECIVERFVFN